jgi:large subunit ribosomal protein L10
MFGLFMQRSLFVDRNEKAAAIEALKGALAGAQLLMVTHYSGMTVAEITDLRRKLRDAGAKFSVNKNRLAKIAIQGTQFENVSALLKGPTAITLASDPVAAAKAAVAFAKANDKLVVLGGNLTGQLLDAAGIDALSKLPSLDELRAKLIGMIQTPAIRLATITQAPAAQLARVLKAYAEKDAA